MANLFHWIELEQPQERRERGWSRGSCGSEMAAAMGVSADGRLSFSHSCDPEWDRNAFLADLRIAGMSSRSIYWRVWGRWINSSAHRPEQNH